MFKDKKLFNKKTKERSISKRQFAFDKDLSKYDGRLLHCSIMTTLTGICEKQASHGLS